MYPRPVPRRPKLATVISLEDAVAKKRLRGYLHQVDQVIDVHRRTLGGLYHSGVLFSVEGARAGRDLLKAHEHLLEAARLLRDLEAAWSPAKLAREVEATYRTLDALLDKSSQLTERTGQKLAGLRGR